ncbi:hypothetical protein [Neobacillus mesonae]|uniref:Uncharacterized protein n=1 Tax=Neobacillus mesonae TaxID=1193713 RepID=A0A3T0HWY0_9BACI|nr:hypothetical protein [Neobacillus mesonae]AZU61635.1 hypothetical protein CHR53_10305 [Neobacillus mesonae]
MFPTSVRLINFELKAVKCLKLVRFPFKREEFMIFLDGIYFVPFKKYRGIIKNMASYKPCFFNLGQKEKAYKINKKVP